MNGVFITGTDTGIGKTWITLGLMRALKKRPATVAGMKPVASGCVRTDAGLRNEDAMHIAAAGDIAVAYEQLNPFAFEHAVSPHAAAALAGEEIDLEKIAGCFDILSKAVDVVVVEGAGGWRVPLGEQLSLADVVIKLKLPVVLVVGMKLGCINHALLTVEAMHHDGVKLAGWVLNQVEVDYSMPDATLDYLVANISAPMIGKVPFMSQFEAEKVADCLDIEVLA